MMQKQKRERSRQSVSPAAAAVSLLKTCQTCFHAKIRCDRTQDSGSCDRCLRLSKECIFAPSRRGNAPAQRQSRIEELEARVERLVNSQKSAHASQDNSNASSPNQGGMHASPRDDQSLANANYTEAIFDPFEKGLLSIATGETLLDRFRTRMTPYFPFVIIPDFTTIDIMRRDRPYLCTAILHATSFDNVDLQRRLARLFEHMVGLKLIEGEIANIDTLQGLLIYQAWAHYSPRPRKYTQYLYLATSVISDMRLDRPKNPALWQAGAGVAADVEWGTDELRTLIGTYYLASSCSVIMQKLRHFPCTVFISECCERLARLGEYPTDRYIQHIIFLQRLVEEVDDVAKSATGGESSDLSTMKISSLQTRLGDFRAALKLPLHDCPALVLQLYSAELLNSELTLPGFPSGVVESRTTAEEKSKCLDCLTESISAVKSLVNIFLKDSKGQEYGFTNLAWIMMGYGLSLAVRLDTLAATCGVSPATTNRLRQDLGVQNILKNCILRLESATTPDVDYQGDRDGFFHLLRRARAIESWYLRQNGYAAEVPREDGHSSAVKIVVQAGAASYPDIAPDAPSMASAMVLDTTTGTVDQQFLFASDAAGGPVPGFSGDGLQTDFFLPDEQEMDYTYVQQGSWNPFNFLDDGYQ